MDVCTIFGTLSRIYPGFGAILITPDDRGTWLVTTPKGHGWLHTSRADAHDEAEWLADNLGGLPVFQIGEAAP